MKLVAWVYPRLYLLTRLAALVFTSALLLVAPPAAAQQTSVVLVSSSSATEMVRNNRSRNFELLNLGATSIWCAIGDSTAAKVGTGREVKPGYSWGMEISYWIRVFCIAEGSSQFAYDGGIGGTVVTQF